MIIGKTIESTKDISFGLSSTLADTYTLYLKTQNYYWNATGPRFHQLHIIFKEQYKEMAASLDYIA